MFVHVKIPTNMQVISFCMLVMFWAFWRAGESDDEVEDEEAQFWELIGTVGADEAEQRVGSVLTPATATPATATPGFLEAGVVFFN